MSDAEAGRAEPPAGGTGDGATAPEWLSLDPDESVIWAGEPSLALLYGTIATGLLTTLVLIGFLILLTVPLSYLRLKHTDYVLTNQSLYVKKGIVSTNIETVDLDRIQNTEYNQSFWGKQFDYGTIAISTAGSGGAEISFQGVPDAKGVRDRIMDVKASRDGRGGDGDAALGDGSPDTTASDADLATLVEEVRATREAFERIEQHLLEADRTGEATEE